MPRIPRGQTQGGIYHIINRGNMRMQVFDDEDDYEFFLKLLKTGLERENIERIMKNNGDRLLFMI